MYTTVCPKFSRSPWRPDCVRLICCRKGCHHATLEARRAISGRGCRGAGEQDGRRDARRWGPDAVCGAAPGFAARQRCTYLRGRPVAQMIDARGAAYSLLWLWLQNNGRRRGSVAAGRCQAVAYMAAILPVPVTGALGATRLRLAPRNSLAAGVRPGLSAAKRRSCSPSPALKCAVRLFQHRAQPRSRLKTRLG
jgi:hypothetical protein